MLLEIAAGSVEDCVAAAAGGADRVELNNALQLGGITPSLGTLLEVKQRTTLPVIAMVRPRPGGFCYSPTEFDTMHRDAEVLLAHGADGLAVGVLHEDGRLDHTRMARFMAHVRASAPGCALVFHRAFDLAPAPLDMLEALIELGVTRILTSGQAARAAEGAPLIRALVERADGRIEILPAAGIRLGNVAALLAATGCTQVHASLSTWRVDRSATVNPAVNFNASELPADRFPATDAATVRRMRTLLDHWKG